MKGKFEWQDKKTSHATNRSWSRWYFEGLNRGKEASQQNSENGRISVSKATCLNTSINETQTLTRSTFGKKRGWVRKNETNH